MRARFPQFSGELMARWVEKFFLLWSRNQWKRERFAPALHVASRNLDPRTWRRSPILSGGFRTELNEMWDAAKRSANQPEQSRSALVLIDVQKGFGSRGELPVPDAEAIVPVINKLIDRFDLVVASQDWHPAEHCSFSAQGGPFPPHCVQNTPGAEFLNGLQVESIDKVFRKGAEKHIDSFSAFIDNAGGKATDIDEYLKVRGVKEIYICGLATDYCVAASAKHALEAGFRVYVVEDACRGIDNPKGNVDKELKALKQAGAVLVNSQEVLASSTASGAP